MDLFFTLLMMLYSFLCICSVRVHLFNFVEQQLVTFFLKKQRQKQINVVAGEDSSAQDHNIAQTVAPYNGEAMIYFIR